MSTDVSSSSKDDAPATDSDMKLPGPSHQTPPGTSASQDAEKVRPAPCQPPGRQSLSDMDGDEGAEDSTNRTQESFASETDKAKDGHHTLLPEEVKPTLDDRQPSEAQSDRGAPTPAAEAAAAAAMWAGDKEDGKNSDFSVSSFGVSLPQLVESTPRDQPPAAADVAPNQGGLPNHDVNCGLLGTYPEFLQSWRTPRCYLFFICVLGMTQGFVVNGLVSVVTPTIERRFQLLGFDLGMIQSMFNVASCVMVTPVSYHGGVAHKPVILGIGAMVMAAGSMVFASPHFLAPLYRPEDSSSSNLCGERTKCASADTGGNVNNYKYLMMIGHALHGIGSSPFYTLGVAYLDQNTPANRASFYMGIFYATSVLGPALGFVLGGYFLSKYTYLTVDSAMFGISSSSANFVGAWWLGFFGASFVAFFIAFPVAAFPRALPCAAEKKAKEAEKDGDKKNASAKAGKSEEKPRSFLNHVKRLCVNPIFICLTLAASSETMLASGLVGFATKIFISMFGISPTKASTLLGAVSVPSACGGTLLGGYVITKLSVRSSTIMRYCTILSIVPWFTLFVFTHSCETSHAALANYTTTDVTALKITFGDLEHSCNAHCNCSGAVYDPVCGTDNFTYYSPCIAGCSNVERVHRTKYYSHCTCVHGPTRTVQSEGGGSFSYMAQRDPCVTDCGLVVVYAVAMFVALFFTFLLIVPALTAMLRSLDEDIKSTGIGVNYVAVRLFGTIPGPMIFGYLIDRSCAIWKMSCSGSSGACAVYENALMGTNLFGLMITVKSASILFFFCASISAWWAGGQEIEPPVELSVNSELTNDAVPAAPAEGAQTVEPGPVGSGNAGGAEVAEPDIAGTGKAEAMGKAESTGKAEATGKAKATGVAKRDEDVPDGHAAKEPAVEKG